MIAAIDVACPQCVAQPGKPCQFLMQLVRQHGVRSLERAGLFHQARVQAAARLAAARAYRRPPSSTPHLQQLARSFYAMRPHQPLPIPRHVCERCGNQELTTRTTIGPGGERVVAFECGPCIIAAREFNGSLTKAR